jgi:hypothetical protein
MKKSEKYVTEFTSESTKVRGTMQGKDLYQAHDAGSRASRTAALM